MISFSLVVASNNLLALKNFTVFLNNYKIFEKPNFIERWMIDKSQVWVNKRAIQNFLDIVTEVKKFETNIGLNDCATSLFTVIYIANEYKLGKMVIHDALELFQIISTTELAFEKLKKPQSDESYK